MMSSMPKGLTAATGMDALTHAIEGYITKGAWEMTDMMHLKAIEIISRELRAAVANTPEGRAGMALGQYNRGHGLLQRGPGHCALHGAPAGRAVRHAARAWRTRIILPTVMEYNAPCTGDKYKYIAAAMGVKGTETMSQKNTARPRSTRCASSPRTWASPRTSRTL